MKRRKEDTENINSTQEEEIENKWEIKADAELGKAHYKKYHDRWRLEKSQIGRRNFP